MREDCIGKCDFLGAVHLGFDHIDRALHRVARARLLAQIVQGDGDRAHGIEQAFEDFLAVAIEHSGVGHEMAHVAHQHERAALEREGCAVGGCEAAICRQFALE